MHISPKVKLEVSTLPCLDGAYVAARVSCTNRHLGVLIPGKPKTPSGRQPVLLGTVTSERFFFKFFNVCEQVAEGQRERQTETEAGSRLQAASTEPNVRFELTSCEIMT